MIFARILLINLLGLSVVWRKTTIKPILRGIHRNTYMDLGLITVPKIQVKMV
jgi:hypothetical protein